MRNGGSLDKGDKSENEEKGTSCRYVGVQMTSYSPEADGRPFQWVTPFPT
jgi:hypothetical protein